ncbi:hypothetical protein [Paenarthrobacter nitroguajacolicus]|jgi:hypothetical protein|uniref:hypothetical protein n=1 Tax=Paenarthrobacter nitroguajacolicus TaxID=211146 RepID=UPI000AE6DEB5|nr:hypothetical protein [Paenarthrobacter nitroguajacolicus]NWL12669.1 hypothetical protein [Paenarthrobacter nitroguajacolicus]NWL35641.1 hypothetical protein [Paenarthrobacter nitroguajacolicus]
MNFPLFHDPLQGTVTVDAPVRDPQIHRQTRATNRPARQATHGSKPVRTSRQREVAKVAEDLQALMARTTGRH